MHHSATYNVDGHKTESAGASLIRKGQIGDTAYNDMGTHLELIDLVRLSNGAVRVWLRGTDSDGHKQSWSVNRIR